MKKYKLIKEYPGSPKLHAEITNENGFVDAIKPQNHPSFWQEIVETPGYIRCMISTTDSTVGKVYNVIKREHNFITFKDNVSFNSLHWPNERFIASTKEAYDAQFVKKEYEILSFKGGIKNKRLGSRIYLNNGIQASDDEWHYNNLDIYSVKRLSDGEIFTIGDKVEFGKCKGTLTQIRLEKHGLIPDKIVVRVTYTNCGDGYSEYELPSIRHSKQPLFKTEDGVDIFESDRYWSVHNSNYLISCYIAEFGKDKPVGNCKTIKDFSTKQAAEEYIIMNKPCLSINDIKTIIEELNGVYCSNEVLNRIFVARIERFSKSKLKL